MDEAEGVTARKSHAFVQITDTPANITTTNSHINAEGNSRIHAGHNIYYLHCTTQHHFDVADSLLQTTLKRKRSLADVGTIPRTREAQEDLDNVLGKLSKLSRSIQGRRGIEEGAEKIARRISAVLDAIVTHKHEELTWDVSNARQLGKLRDTVRWEEHFDINSVPQRRAMGRNARAKGRRISVEIGHWYMSLTTTTINVRHEWGLQETQILCDLRVEPRLGALGSPLAVYFSEHTDGHARGSIPPTILAYNRISNDADVFKLVSWDNIEGLQRLLACGRATIRDADESGRSLLHVGLHATSMGGLLTNLSMLVISTACDVVHS